MAARVCQVAPFSGVYCKGLFSLQLYSLQSVETQLQIHDEFPSQTCKEDCRCVFLWYRFSSSQWSQQLCDNDPTVSGSLCPTYHLPHRLTLPFTAICINGSLMSVIWASEVTEPWPKVDTWTWVWGSYGGYYTCTQACSSLWPFLITDNIPKNILEKTIMYLVSTSSMNSK